MLFTVKCCFYLCKFWNAYTITHYIQKVCKCREWQLKKITWRQSYYMHHVTMHSVCTRVQCSCTFNFDAELKMR